MRNEYLFFLQHEYMHVCIFCIYIDMHIQKHLGSSKYWIYMDIHVGSIYVYSHAYTCICIYTCIWMHRQSCNSGRL